MLRRRSLLLLSLGWIACGGATQVGPDGVPVAVDDDEAPVVPPLRDAHEVAAKVVSAKLTALVHVERVRNHPLAAQVAAMDAWGPVFDGTGIEPLKDVDRAFVAAANVRDRKAVIAVAEHHVEPERIDKALDTLIEKSGEDGGRIDGFDFPAARVFVKGRKSVVMAVTPTLLVVTSEPYANAAAKLSETGGLPEPSGPEAVLAAADHPSSTLKAKHAPKIPPTIDHAVATVTMREDGGADVEIEGNSKDEAQAKKDAEELTKAIEAATTVKISIIKVRAFAPIEFTSSGSKVVAKRLVTKQEMQTLLGFAQMMAK